MGDLGGLRKGDKVIFITHFPGLKKPVLAIGNKYVMQKIASFDSEEAAEGFLAILCEWLGAKREEMDVKK